MLSWPPPRSVPPPAVPPPVLVLVSCFFFLSNYIICELTLRRVFFCQASSTWPARMSIVTFLLVVFLVRVDFFFFRDACVLPAASFYLVGFLFWVAFMSRYVHTSTQLFSEPPIVFSAPLGPPRDWRWSSDGVDRFSDSFLCFF